MQTNVKTEVAEAKKKRAYDDFYGRHEVMGKNKGRQTKSRNEQGDLPGNSTMQNLL